MFASQARYTLSGRISAHRRGVYALGLSDTGKLLASGGCDGLKIWDVSTRSEIHGPPQNPNFSGWPSVVEWLPSRGHPDGALIYGTGNGALIVWTRTTGQAHFQEACSTRLETGSEVMTIALDCPPGSVVRLAVGLRGCKVVVLDYDHRSSRFVSGFNVQLDNIVPRCVAFTNTTTRDIYVLGMYGQMLTIRHDGTEVTESKKVAHIIGYAAFASSGSYFAVDNTDTGFNLHRVESGSNVRTFETRPPMIVRAKQVAFGEEGAIVVGGSDHGRVYVFETSSGNVLQALQHSKASMVQTVTTRDIDGTTLIACASSDDREGVSISIWRRATAESRDSQPLALLKKAGEVLHVAGCLVIVASLIVYFQQAPWQSLVSRARDIAVDVLTRLLRNVALSNEHALGYTTAFETASDR